jgi:8-oxo-dGTP pyrophosphatase MutT (NUDIX family)
MQMNLPDVVDYLSARLRKPLPGSIAHEPLRATPIGALKPKFEHKTSPKPGSVLILLYEKDGEIRFPLTKRPDYLGAHGGQVSLPGGKKENDENAFETAIREGEEEVGIHKAEVEVIGRLSDFFVIPSNFMIAPVVAYAKSVPRFIPQPTEVERILTGNLEALIQEDAVHQKEILAAKMYPMIAPHFLIDNEIVWGATAMMLNELRTVLQENY